MPAETTKRPLTADLVLAKLRKGVRQLKAVQLVPGWPAVNLQPEQTFYVHPKCWKEDMMVTVEDKYAVKKMVSVVATPAIVTPPRSVAAVLADVKPVMEDDDDA